MARHKSKTLTELELAIMRIVWNAEQVSVEHIEEELQQAGRPLAPPSIRTMLGILMEKGYVARRPEGRKYTYRAVVAADQAEQRFLKELVDQVFDGSASSLVAALVAQGMIGKNDLDTAQRLIRKHERGDAQ